MDSVSCLVFSAVLLVLWILRHRLIVRPYKAYVAWILNRITESIKEGLRDEKARIFQYVNQYQKQLNRDVTVLEIGSGSVNNLAFLPQNSKVICLEPNPFFNDYANKNIKKEENTVSIETVQGYAEDMPFESETFDVVVSTLVLCSVQDMKKCLAEIKRVLKPGGKFVFLEHVAFEDKSSWRYFCQVVMNPVQRIIYDNCNTSRDIGTCIQTAGFSHVDIKTFLHDPFPIWVRPCISGVATK